MNCIDAIEGIVKTIVDCTLEDLASDNLDDTLFGNIKSVDRAYLDYYYDYIYDRGVYPP